MHEFGGVELRRGCEYRFRRLQRRWMRRLQQQRIQPASHHPPGRRVHRWQQRRFWKPSVDKGRIDQNSRHRHKVCRVGMHCYISDQLRPDSCRFHARSVHVPDYRLHGFAGAKLRPHCNLGVHVLCRGRWLPVGRRSEFQLVGYPGTPRLLHVRRVRLHRFQCQQLHETGQHRFGLLQV